MFQVLNGDNLELLKSFHDNHFDAVVTDPPYGISIVQGGSIGGSKPFGSVGGGKLAKVGKYAPVAGDDSIDVAIEAIQLIQTLQAQVEIIWGGNYYANHLSNSSCWIVWNKQNTGNFADCELAWTNQKTAVRMFTHMWNGMLKASEHGQKRVHPTQKPVTLLEYLIKKSSNEGDYILDPFAGSFSTCKAAKNINRNSYGIELQEKYLPNGR